MNMKKTMCLALIHLSVVSVAETYTWQGPDEGSVGSGMWGVAENWLVGTERSEQVPSECDNAQFVGNPRMTVTLDRDYSVSNIFIPLDDANRPNVTLDLGGHTLSATNAIRIQRSWDDSPCIAITNGMVTTRVVSCGIAKSTEWDWGAGRLILRGADTELYVTNSLSIIGKYSNLQIEQGAKANCSSFEGSTGQTGGSAEISGTGSELTVRNSFMLREHFLMKVANGGKLSVASDSRVMIGRFRSGGRGTSLIVDGGTFEVTKGSVTVGDADSGFVRDNSLILTNEAVMTTVGTVALGCGHQGGKAATNTLAVCNGSTLTGGVKSEIWSYGLNRDRDYWSHDNRVIIDDGEVSVMRMRIGNAAARPVSSNDVLMVRGTRAKIALTGTTADAFTLRMGSGLHLTIPRDGFNVTPIQVPNGGATISDDLDKGAKKVDFFFDAGMYSRKHKGKPVTLIECGLDSTESLQRLVDNVTYVNTPETLRGTLEVVDGKKLIYNPPPAPGLMLLLK